MGLQEDGWQIGWSQCGQRGGWTQSPVYEVLLRCEPIALLFRVLAKCRGEGDITHFPGAAWYSGKSESH